MDGEVSITAYWDPIPPMVEHRVQFKGRKLWLLLPFGVDVDIALRILESTEPAAAIDTALESELAAGTDTELE